MRCDQPDDLGLGRDGLDSLGGSDGPVHVLVVAYVIRMDFRIDAVPYIRLVAELEDHRHVGQNTVHHPIHELVLVHEPVSGVRNQAQLRALGRLVLLEACGKHSGIIRVDNIRAVSVAGNVVLQRQTDQK